MDGSLNPNDHDYQLAPEATYHTICCICTIDMESKNYASVTTGMEVSEQLSTDSDLLLKEKFVWVGCQDNGYDFFFLITQECNNLFWNPGIFTKNKVGAREDYLRNIPLELLNT